MANFVDNYGMQIRGQAEIARLEQEVRAAAAALEDIQQPTQEFEELARRNAARIDQLNRQLDGVSGQSKATQTMIELGRAADDLQYGVAGAANNLQQLAVQAGASGPVILALTALTIVVNLLVKNWDKLSDAMKEAFGNGINADLMRTTLEKTAIALQKAKEEAEELGKKQVLSTAEAIKLLAVHKEELELQRKLTEEERKQANVKALLEGKSLEQREREAATKSTLEDAGGGALTGIAGQLESQIIADALKSFRERWEKTQTSIAEAMELPEFQSMPSYRNTIIQEQVKLDQEMKLEIEKANKRGRDLSQDLIDRLSRGEQAAIDEIRKRVGDRPILDEVQESARTSKSSTQRRQDADAARKKADDDADRERQKELSEQRQMSDRLQAKRDADFLQRIRKGEATDAEARAKFLRQGQSGEQLRAFDLEDAQADFQARQAAKAEQEAEKAKREADSARDRMIKEKSRVIEDAVGPQIEMGLLQRGNTAQAQNMAGGQVMRIARQMGLNAADAQEVASQVMQDVGQDLEGELAKMTAIQGNGQRATVAVMQKLLLEVARAQQQANSYYAQIQTLHNQMNMLTGRNGRPMGTPLIGVY